MTPVSVGDKEFATRLAEAVWLANDGYCEIEVYATYIEPYHLYMFSQIEYNKIQQFKQCNPECMCHSEMIPHPVTDSEDEVNESNV